MTGSNPIEAVLVEDDQALLEATAQALMLDGIQVQPFCDAQSALKVLTRDFAGVVVSDVRMPGMDGLELFARLRALDPDLPVILTTAHGDVHMAVEAMKDGAADFLTKPYSSIDLVKSVRAAATRRALALENRRLHNELSRRSNQTVLGSSDMAENLRSVIAGVSRADIDVIIEGGVGTGKSFAARLIHDLSPRAGRPFVTIDPGILAHEDAELLLFGREPSAGLSRTGLLERGQGGTLLLDELHQGPEHIHSRLLAMLDSRSVLPIGADRPRKLDVRIILTRNPDAPDDQSGRRRALEQRLGAVRIGMPALVARRTDIPEIFRHFVRQHERDLEQEARPIGESEFGYLQTHDWPGNLRELSGFARAFVLGLGASGERDTVGSRRPTLHEIVSQFERTVLEDAMYRAKGNVAQVQAMLVTPRKTIYDKLDRYGIKPNDFRNG